MDASRIFVSYRRQDSPGFAGRIADHLDRHFGDNAVFRDVEAIEYGTDFVVAIDRAVASCAVLIMVIGPSWTSVKDSQGRRRLDNQDDFVRLELATALKRGIRVIPVLVMGATPPTAAELPEDLQPMARRQALEISDERFATDVARLIQAIESGLEKDAAPTLRARGRRAAEQKPATSGRWRAVAAVAGGFVLLAGGSIMVSRSSGGEDGHVAAGLHSSPGPSTERAPPSDRSTQPSPPPAAGTVAVLANGAPEVGTQRPAADGRPGGVAPAGSGAGTEDPPAQVRARFEPTGVWEGAWNDRQVGQRGRLMLEVAPDGAVAGWLTNEAAQRTFRLLGRMSRQLKLELACECPANEGFAARGGFRSATENEVRGRLELSSDRGVFGRSDFLLKRTAPAR